MLDGCPGIPIEKVRTFLGSFLFPGNDVQKKIHVLSGGEKNRVAMVKVLLQQANLLLLDEPTNHLDLYAKEVLVQALQQYKGTFLLVSHDHDVIERVADVIFELTPHGVITFEGTYEEYLYYKQKTEQKADHPSNTLQPITKPTKQSDTKRLHKELRALERTISQLEQQRDKLGLQLSELGYEDPEYQKILKKLDVTQKELDAALQQWEIIGNQIN